MSSMRSYLQRIAHRAMLDRGLLPDFSAAEMAEAQDLNPGIGPADPETRDLRTLLWASIDNDDSRDLDQLTVAEAMPSGLTKILIAIADVDAKVKQGSALDRHAMTNTTSVYTDARTFPMLPELLSTDLTSLNEGRERLALVVEMRIDGDGQVTDGQLFRAVVVGDAVADVRLDRQNRAKQLIEDFMVAGNITTARFLEQKRSPSIRRVLRSPERWDRIVELAATHGAQLPGKPDARALEAFLATGRSADPERFPDLSLTVVKLLGRGEYAVETPGQGATEHFGLAVRDYTHSTAPNRRYPDLLTQRLVKAALTDQPPPYVARDLGALAQHCTAAEDAAAKVERQVRKSAAALFLRSQIGETFEGFITGASAKGTWVRLLRPPVEGRIVSGFEGLDVGDRVTVKLEHTDVERGFIDFSRRK